MANEANHTGPLAKGETRWHSSGEDEGPDVGLELGLGGGVALYVGELATRTIEEAGVDLKRFPDGWWFALNDMGETRIVAAVTDEDAARELFETISGWVRAASEDPRSAAVSRAQIIDDVVSEAKQTARLLAKHQNFDRSDDSRYADGFETACEILGETDHIAEHVRGHDARIAGAGEIEGAAADPVDLFLAEVRAELVRARAKFPGDRIMTIALAEEFGELCKAILDEPAERVRKEAVQTAVMAARVVLDGDGSVAEWRALKGLDPLAAFCVSHPGQRAVTNLDGDNLCLECANAWVKAEGDHQAYLEQEAQPHG